jgi:hypothetical protein
MSAADTWLAENLDALESSNRFVESCGLPLGHYAHDLGRTQDASSGSAGGCQGGRRCVTGV